jgi:hypothetical protein
MLVDFTMLWDHAAVSGTVNHESLTGYDLKASVRSAIQYSSIIQEMSCVGVRLGLSPLNVA